MLPEAFPAEDVRDVDLDDRKFCQNQGIENGDRCMRESCWVNDDPVSRAARLLNPVDQVGFAVALAEIQLDAGRRRMSCAVGTDIIEALLAVNLRFPDTEHVQVGAVQDKYSGGGGQLISLIPGSDLPVHLITNRFGNDCESPEFSAVGDTGRFALTASAVGISSEYLRFLGVIHNFTGN